MRMPVSYEHIFGPVLSRRLGVSLGIDVTPHKTCSLDCVYCECGKTTCLTADRKEFVPLDRVIHELSDYFQTHEDPDYITFSGSGEPTLYTKLKEVMAFIKQTKPDIRMAVLTNATLFNDPDVCTTLLAADRVVPSLDAATRDAFERINRPAADVDLAGMIQGMADFSSKYKGEFFLEVMILPGLNDRPEDLAELRKAIHRIRPDRVQFNTLDRPGTRPGLSAATTDEMMKVGRMINYPSWEIIARKKAKENVKGSREDIDTAIIETVRRRPSTREDLIGALGASPRSVDQCIKALEKKGVLKKERLDQQEFFQIVKERS